MFPCPHPTSKLSQPNPYNMFPRAYLVPLTLHTIQTTNPENRTTSASQLCLIVRQQQVSTCVVCSISLISKHVECLKCRERKQLTTSRLYVINVLRIHEVLYYIPCGKFRERRYASLADEYP